MAWIVKNSATQEIDRREEPYLDDALKAHLQADILTRYPTKRAATLPVLHAIQHKHGWLSHQAIQEAADFLDLHASEVLDTATFYEDFLLEPKGKYLIKVCQSISCELLDHSDLLNSVKNKLGIEAGETTDDGRFTLMTVECLGSCGTAPCALLNETLHECLTTEALDQLLDRLD